MITIYGKPACKYCTQAKDLLHSLGVDFKYINLMEDDDAMKKVRADKFKSVPAIYHGNEIIGGFDELKIWTQNLPN